MKSLSLEQKWFGTKEMKRSLKQEDMKYLLMDERELWSFRMPNLRILAATTADSQVLELMAKSKYMVWKFLWIIFYFKNVYLLHMLKVQMLKFWICATFSFKNLLLNLSQSLKTLKYLKEKRLNLSALYQRRALKSSGRGMIRHLNLEINMTLLLMAKRGS